MKKSMDYDFSTPMMKQYESIKKEYTDCLLFYRLGDFYEMFLDDAHIASKVLDITLTSRTRGKDGRIPMAGVPYHAVDSYLHKLVKAGYKVAICEQITEPNAKGIVERDVVRVVTPGTIIDEQALDKKEHNFILCIDIYKQGIAFAWADVSTGNFYTIEHTTDDQTQVLKERLHSLHPAECIVNETMYHTPAFLSMLTQEHHINTTWFQDWNSYCAEPEKHIKSHFTVSYLESAGLDKKPHALLCSSVLLGYLKQTQKNNIHHVTTLEYVHDEQYLSMDRSTMMNLELFSTIREHDTHASLLHVIDKTKTAMGGRLFRQWLTKPLRNKHSIEMRYDAVDFLLEQKELRISLSRILTHIHDIERILTRLSMGTGNAKDLLTIADSLDAAVQILHILKDYSTPEYMNEIQKNINGSLIAVQEKIKRTIVEHPPLTIKDGGMIRDGIHAELAALRQTVNGGKNWLTQLEIQERKRTGIQSLKIRYNKVFGFYIEISHANTSRVPDNYIRKQTLVNGERYITPELKEYETKILTSEEAMNLLEYQIFQDLLHETLTHTKLIQLACFAIAQLDCLVSFAETAIEKRFIRPVLHDSHSISIIQSRHPVVETLLTDTQFVPNDLDMNTEEQLIVLTGPNMAGKSVFIRQIAITILLAQMGSFVPAKKAHLPIIDTLFVRSGASDAITSGMSTFMVEMVETAYILKHATQNSLVIMDEIGRGTSTYDGISIAWAVAEYLVTSKKTKPKTLFATHYHELQELEQKYPNHIKNYHMSVIEENGMPIFLHTIQKGGASASYGIAVGKLAGLPDNVIEHAQQILQTLETHHMTEKSKKIFRKKTENPVKHPMVDLIRQLNINDTTPLQALSFLNDLKRYVENDEYK